MIALIHFCVRRRLPVLAVTAAIAAFGIRAYLTTPVEAFPDVTNVQVNVIAQLPGLAPEEIERQVTVPLERVLNGTPGMISMRSESMFGLSLVWLTFDDAVDSFRARTIVTERLGDAGLPEGTEVSLSPEATPLGEIFQFTMVSDRHTEQELRSELQWTVSRVLLQVPGVADVVAFGGFLKELHVQVDPTSLRAHDLTIADVSDAIAKSNRNVGGGFLRHGEQELTVRGLGYFTTPADVQSVVVASHRGVPVRVGDVARVVTSHTPTRGAVGVNLDTTAVEGFALLRRGENPSVVLDGIHDKVQALNGGILPKGMRLEPFYDRSTLVENTLATVHHNLLFGALLVVGVVWLFLRSLRCSLVVASIIPLALLTAFIGLRAIGLPANLISMGAIDFGILVDGAVVLVESVIHATAEKRPKTQRELLPLIARSALDVAQPTFFAMAIIIAALIPVFTLERVEGRIFRPLALTYSFALVGALVFALTTIPALCAVVLRPADGDTHEPRLLVWARERYDALLRRLLGRPIVVAAGLLVLIVAGGVVATRLGSEFLPELDEGDVLIYVEMPPSIALDRGTEILREVRRRMLAFPEVANTLSEQGRPEDGTDNEGVNMSETFIRLRPRTAWRPGWTKERLVEAMRTSLDEIPGVYFNFSQPIKDNVEEAVSGVRGKIVLKIFGSDLGRMKATLEKAVSVLREVPGVVDLGLYREASVPQLQIGLDRAALARAGITVGAAEDVIETSLSGRVVTTMWEGERPVPVRVILPLAERDDETRIGDLQIPTVDGGRIPLRAIATLERAMGRASINREANSRVLSLKFNVEGRDMGSVIKDAQAAVARQVTLPDGHFFEWAGEFENQQRAMNRLAVIVPVSAFVVCGLLYAALGSMRSALTVLVATPFAMTGGIFALAVTAIPLSVSAAVGFIALLGQACLASLLVVSVVNQRRRDGVDTVEAIATGAAMRFRVVVMTALLAILGLLPAAVSSGVGSETQRPFAVVIIGGLITAVPVTLFALPVLYGALVRRVPRLSTDADVDWHAGEADA